MSIHSSVLAFLFLVAAVFATDCPKGQIEMGPAIGGRCPEGFGATVVKTKCCFAQPETPKCPTGSDPIGPATGGKCPAGTTINGNFCC